MRSYFIYTPEKRNASYFARQRSRKLTVCLSSADHEWFPLVCELKHSVTYYCIYKLTLWLSVVILVAGITSTKIATDTDTFKMFLEHEYLHTLVSLFHWHFDRGKCLTARTIPAMCCPAPSRALLYIQTLCNNCGGFGSVGDVAEFLQSLPK